MIAHYHLVHNLLFSHLLSKNLRIKVYGTMIYSVLGQHQYIIINTLVLATRFGFYHPSSGLCLLYGGTFSVHIHYGIP